MILYLFTIEPIEIVKTDLFTILRTYQIMTYAINYQY